MKHLWAPWRSSYIGKLTARGSKRSSCFLCDYARTPNRDASNLVLFRGRTCFAVLNRYPYNVGHAMITPLRHVAALDALTDPERVELLRIAAAVQAALDQEYRCDGHNLGINIGRAAGAGLPGHLHLHIVPRWNGDTNFMPVVGGAKVMPLPLGEVQRALRRKLRARR